MLSPVDSQFTVFDVQNPAMTRLPRWRTYDAKWYHGDYFIINHLRRFLENQLDQCVVSGCRVCDIGCGEQPLRAHIEALGGIYTGVDIAQNSSGTVDVIASITNIPLPNSCFDVILCTEVLEHVSDTFAAFHELARLVKGGGKIILTVPFAYPLHEEPYDFVRLTPYQISECAARHHLEIKELRVSGNEIEVLATVWSNMWYRMALGQRSFMRRIWNRLMCVSVNLMAMVANLIMEPILPQKYYLSVLGVLTKTVG